MKLVLTLLGLALASGTSVEEDYETHHRVEHHEAYRVTKKVPVQKPHAVFLHKKLTYPVKTLSSRPFDGGKKSSLPGKTRGVKPLEKYPISLIKKASYPIEKRIPVKIPFELTYRVPVVKRVPLELEVDGLLPYDPERSSRYPILKPVPQSPRRGVRYEVKIPVQVPISYHVPRNVPVYLKQEDTEEGRDLLAPGGGGYQGYNPSHGAFNYGPREANSHVFFSTVQGQYSSNHIGPFS